MFDNHANFAYSTISIAPSPGISGTSITIDSGDGSKFPDPPFNIVVWPPNSMPVAENAEILRVVSKDNDNFVVERAQEGSTARVISVGDQVGANITLKILTDIEVAVEGNSPAQFEQLTPDTTWIINHNRNRYPFLHFRDSAGDTIYGDLVYIDANTAQVTFTVPVSGTAYLVG